MRVTEIVAAIDTVSAWLVFALIVILGFIVVLGLVNAVVVVVQAVAQRVRAHPEEAARLPLPVGLVTTDTYLHAVADILLVAVGIELADTLAAFVDKANPKVYLSGVVGAALVAITRRIIVFFNPEANQDQSREIYAYGALIGVLAGAYVLIRLWG